VYEPVKVVDSAYTDVPPGIVVQAGLTVNVSAVLLVIVLCWPAPAPEIISTPLPVHWLIAHDKGFIKGNAIGVLAASTRVFDVPLVAVPSSVSAGKECHCLHATWHDLQPIHFDVSINIVISFAVDPIYDSLLSC
jgi:hypothetical protein